MLSESGGEDNSKSSSSLTALQGCMSERFAESDFLRAVPEKLGGAVCFRFDPAVRRGEFLWTHTTPSMGLAFQTTACREATAKMSRLPPRAKGEGAAADVATTAILVESVPFLAVQHPPPPPMPPQPTAVNGVPPPPAAVNGASSEESNEAE